MPRKGEFYHGKELVLLQNYNMQKDKLQWLENWPIIAKTKTAAKGGRAKVREHRALVRCVAQDLQQSMGGTAGGNAYNLMLPAAMVDVVARGSGQDSRVLIAQEPDMQFEAATAQLHYYSTIRAQTVLGLFARRQRSSDKALVLMVNQMT